MRDSAGGDGPPRQDRADPAAGPVADTPVGSDTPAPTERIAVGPAAEPQPTRAYPVIAPHAPPPPNRLGQYRLLDRLGQGGMGAVYRAEHLRLKRDVAVKILGPAHANDLRAVARFQREMEVVGRIDHPNVVRATDAGEAAGVPYLVMELLDGTDLARLLDRRGPLPVAEACEAARQAAAGLQAAHDHGLVHRDVKPSNLMLTAVGRVKVLDLGLALLQPGARQADGLTGVGEVMGTAEYMAPEQWTETHAVDGRADVYSLGCSLYALLTGGPPFRDPAGSSPRIMLAHQVSPAPSVAAHRPDVPPRLAALLARMLAKDPADRPASAAAAAADLAEFARGADLSALAGRAGPATTPVVLHRLVPPAPPRRRAARALYAAVAILVVGTSAVGLAGRLVGPRPAPAAPKPAPAAEPDIPLNVWKNLLAAAQGEPGKRLWLPAVGAVFDHNPAAEVLTLQSPRPALVRLGAVGSDRPYRVQVGLRQVRWDGGVGVYFGGRPVPPGDDFVFQFLVLHRTDAGPGRTFALGRGRGTAGPGGVAVVEFATQHVPIPGAGEHLLELDLRAGALAAVRWDGTACPELVGAGAAARAARLFPAGELGGELGVYCNGAAVTVSTARQSLAD